MKQQSIFNGPQKKIQGAMYDLAVKMRQTDFSNRQEAESVMTNLESLMNVIENYGDLISTVVLPVIKEEQPQLAESMDNDLAKLDFTVYRLRMAKRGFERNNTNEAGKATINAFDDLVAFMIYLMHKTGTMTGPVLNEMMETEEGKMVYSFLVDLIREETIQIPKNPMIPITDEYEIIDWLNSVKDSSPAFVYKSMLHLTREVLLVKRLNNVHIGLSGLAIAA